MSLWIKVPDGSLVNIEQLTYVGVVNDAYSPAHVCGVPAVIGRTADARTQHTLELCDSLEQAKARLEEYWEPLLTKKTQQV